MSNLTPARWTNPGKAAFAALLLTAGALGAAEPDQPPRTKAEAARIAAAMRVVPEKLNPFELNPGGRGTLHRPTPGPELFKHPLTGMNDAARMDFVLGQAMFEKLWVPAPSSTKASDGLGPLYNARSCAMCHPGNGRGMAPAGDGPLPVSLVLRLSVTDPLGDPQGIQDYLATRPDPDLGTQIQTDAATGFTPEGQPGVRYNETPIAFTDGQVISLRRPIYDAGSPLSAQTMVSPRIAPPLAGMGLIAAIADADILAGTDPDDTDGNGVSGRANLIPTPTGPALGRFGWKAGVASLRTQVADAFFHDIGISSPLFPQGWGDCTETQTACRMALHGDDDPRGTELDAQGLDLTLAYVTGLAVPARTGATESLRGRDLFHATGCATCHRPAYVTERLPDDPLRSFQMIWPYSDFLLHDMGEGLADNRPEHRATGREWRTPPLWSIGKTELVSGMGFYLHDGRARSLTEAIVWHGGEATAARDLFLHMPKPDRDALIAFLESL